MNVLNVRYVGISVGVIDHDGPSTSLIGFAQMARLSRLTVMVTGISNAAIVSKLQSIGRLASGPCFAEPRRVKRNRSASAQSQIELAA